MSALRQGTECAGYAMITALGLLLGCQLIGELLATATALPVPGPVIGLVLMLAVLLIRGQVNPDLSSTSHNLLKHLSLLFIPAGVGFIAHADRLQNDLYPLIAGLVISTTLTIIVTAAVFVGVSRLMARQK